MSKEDQLYQSNLMHTSSDEPTPSWETFPLLGSFNGYIVLNLASCFILIVGPNLAPWIVLLLIYYLNSAVLYLLLLHFAPVRFCFFRNFWFAINYMILKNRTFNFIVIN